MILSTKPRVIVMNDRKIHVIRKPGFTTWLFLSLSAIIFIAISEPLTKNYLYLVALVLGEIMFSLDTFGEWQELLLNKEENKAVIVKYTWIDRLPFNLSQNSCIKMKLTDIRHVGVSIEMGLFILHRNGRTISLSMEGFNREELQKLKRDINYFLHANRNEFIDTDIINSKVFPLVTSSSKNVCNVPVLVRKEVPSSIDILKNNKIQYEIHHNLSLPILRVDRHKKKHRQFSLRKGPCVQNSIYFYHTTRT